MDKNKSLREHLLYLLRGGGAHLTFDAVVEDFSIEKINERIAHIPYTAWELLEHLRIAQWDILEFSRNANHISPDWPAGYWPAKDARPATEGDWTNSVAGFRKDLDEMIELVEDPATDLYARIPHGEGQTILREALLVADHNSHHLGQLIMLKRILQSDGSKMTSDG